MSYTVNEIFFFLNYQQEKKKKKCLSAEINILTMIDMILLHNGEAKYVTPLVGNSPA